VSETARSTRRFYAFEDLSTKTGIAREPTSAPAGPSAQAAVVEFRPARLRAPLLDMKVRIEHAVESAVGPRETLAYGAVHLDVTDGERSLGFWHDIVGLSVIEEVSDLLRLGVDGRELVVLHSGARQGVVRGRSGLYHLAIHLPDETEFARVLWRLIVAGYPNSPTDHTMSKSTYLNDPDSLGLELTLETPERLGSWSNEGGRLRLIDAEGRERRLTEPLDLNEVLSHLPGRSFDQPLLPPETKIGHVHLQVSDLEAAVHFYRDLIGFQEHMYLPRIGFADLSAGGRYPHRLALNVWEGEGAPQPPSGSVGLRFFELVLAGEETIDETIDRLQAAGHQPEQAAGGMFVDDPAGNTIYLTSPAWSE
jgi:catechol 2,3-dioxygenase